jgi:hypothetical protein
MQLAFTQISRKFLWDYKNFLFLNSYGELRVSAFGIPATNGPIVSVGMIDEYGALDEMRIDGENQSTRGNFPPLLIRSQ